MSYDVEHPLYQKIAEKSKDANADDAFIYKQILEKLDGAKSQVNVAHAMMNVMTSSYEPKMGASTPQNFNRKNRRESERKGKALNKKLAELVTRYFKFCDATRDKEDPEGSLRKQTNYLTTLNKAWIQFIHANQYNITVCQPMLIQKCYEMIMLHQQVAAKSINANNQITTDVNDSTSPGQNAPAEL